MNRGAMIAAMAGSLVLAGCGTSDDAPPTTRRCEAPAEQAIATSDGIVIGRVGPDGAPAAGALWLEPLIADTPVYGETGDVDALLAVPQPPIELLACHGDRFRVRYPVCGEWLEGEIDAVEPGTGKPTVRIVEEAASASSC